MPAGVHARGAGDWPPGADIGRVETVRVLVGGDGFENAATVHLFRKRHLNEDPVDLGAMVQVVDDCQKLSRRHGLGRRDLVTVNPEVAARRHLVPNVNLGARIVASQNDRQARRTPGRCKLLNPGPQFA